MTNVILLSRGYQAVVDAADYTDLSQHNWSAWMSPSGTVYARRNMRRGGKRGTLYLHQQVLGYAPRGLEIDHINGNSLDNRRCNLRFCTHQQNSCNRLPNRTKLTKYKGVKKHNNCNRYEAKLKTLGKWHYLGLYKTQEEAALAYNEAAKKLFGEFAHLNRIEEGRWKTLV